MKDKILAVIPARAGSKRIPDKNIRNFLGKPLIAYTIKQALKVPFVDRVIVDTDSSKYAAIAKKYGAEVPFLRPVELATDTATANDALLHLLDRLKREEGYAPDYVVYLQTTSPLRELSDIKECWELMRSSGATTVLTACSAPPWIYYIDEKKNIIRVNGSKNQSPNTRVLRPMCILNGGVFLIKTKAFLKEKIIITKNTKVIICDKWRSVDLDTPEEWVMAELLYKNKKSFILN